jgi:hypothetical protein
MNPDIFEAIMLICFGVAWPISIFRMLRTKSSEGKSIHFLVVVIVGYIAGTLSDYYGQRNAVIYLYLINTCMVIVDLVLTIKYRKRPEALKV